MRTRFTRLFLTILLVALPLAACGDDSDSSLTADDPANGADDSSPDIDPSDNDENSDDGGDGGDGGDESGDFDEWPPEDLDGSGSAGTVTVDGTEYGIDVIVECDMTDFFAGDGRVREWEIQGSGLADPDDQYSDPVVVKVFTGTKSNPDEDEQGIGWDGPEGLFEGSATGNGTWQQGSESFDAAPVEVGEQRVTGELMGRSAMGREPVQISVDLGLPDASGVACY